MTGIFCFFYNTILDFPYFIKSKHTLLVKTKIVLAFLRLTLKLFTVNKFLPIKNESIFGFKIIAFDYGTIHFLFREIFLRNEYYFETDKKNPIIFDCGANIGFATLYFKWLYPESRIFAFEPDKTTFRFLKRNIELNGLKNISLYNMALWDRKKKINLCIDKENPGWLAMSAKQDRLHKDRIRVEAAPLSLFMPKGKIDFLKMDIEGSEDNVIGELNENKKLGNIREMVVEYHHETNKKKSHFSKFLKIFEDNNFEYQIDAKCIPIFSKEKFQDILIRFYSR